MGMEGNAPKRKVDQAPQAPAVEPAAPANNDKGFTAEEEAWFQKGEARTRAAEAEAQRRAEQRAYDETQKKIKALKGRM